MFGLTNQDRAWISQQLQGLQKLMSTQASALTTALATLTSDETQVQTGIAALLAYAQSQAASVSTLSAQVAALTANQGQTYTADDLASVQNTIAAMEQDKTTLNGAVPATVPVTAPPAGS